MPTSTSNRTRGLSTTDLALIATFAALIAVCAVSAALPFGVNGIPVTLQLFAVFLAGAVLGPWRGFLAVLLYLVVGAAGLPIFATGASGLAPFSGGSGGYLVSFPVVAAIVGLGVSRLRRRDAAITAGLVVAAGLVGEVVSWIAGSLGIIVLTDAPVGKTFVATLGYVPADLVKLAIAAVVAAAVHRAFPALLHRPVRQRPNA